MLTVVFAVAYQGVHQTASRYALPILAAATIGAGASVSRRAGPLVALMGAIVWCSTFVVILRYTDAPPVPPCETANGTS